MKGGFPGEYYAASARRLSKVALAATDRCEMAVLRAGVGGVCVLGLCTYFDLRVFVIFVQR
jgi:hypothetical protein